MHVCKWFAQLLAETITNVNLKSYMFTVLVLKRTELHSFYIYFFVCVGLSSRISSDPHSLWLQLHWLLFNPNRIRVLFNAGKKINIHTHTHTYFIRYTLSILDYLLFSELPHSSWPILNKALETVSADLLTEISSKTNLILALWYGALSCWEWPSEDKYTAVIKKLIWDGSMPSCYLHQVLNKHENIANEIKTH